MKLFSAMGDKNAGFCLSWGGESIFRGIVFGALGRFAACQAARRPAGR